MKDLLSLANAFPLTDWLIASTAILLLGISKAGLKGIDVLIVTLMLLVFGGKSSAGILLPLLCVGDLIAVIYYRRDVDWQHLFRLLPWMITGVLIGTWVGNELDEGIFKKVMAVIIVVGVLIMLWQENRRNEVIPKKRWFATLMGLTAGFTTMMGNLAGPFANLYFLIIRFDKKAFIGTTAWLFMFVNLFKVPFHFFVWGTINQTTTNIGVLLLPALVVGFVVGIVVVKRMSNLLFRRMVVTLTLIGAVVILFN